MHQDLFLLSRGDLKNNDICEYDFFDTSIFCVLNLKKIIYAYVSQINKGPVNILEYLNMISEIE